MQNKTWNINDGYPVDCSCYNTSSEMNLSGATITIDLTEVESKLDTIISQGSSQVNNLTDILTELETLNSPVNQTELLATGVTVIPANVYSYSILNLGFDPLDPNSAKDAFIVNGLTINQKILQYSNDAGGVKPISNTTTVDPNGNTLLIVYNQ